MRGEFIDVGGVRLYYYAAGTRGAGEPIVLVHGFPTSGHVWGELVPLLPRGHRVVVVDLLGYGRSDRPGRASLSVEAHAQRVLQLMDALGISAATLVGHHLGGAIVQAVAVRAPQRVTRVALVDSIGADVTVTGTFALVRAFLPVARVLPSSLLFRGLRADLGHRYMDPDRGRHSIDLYLRPFESDGGRRTLLRHIASFDEREIASLTTSLANVQQPVALIWGADDRFVPPSVARELRSKLPHATLDIIESARHFTPEEAPERIASVVDGLLRR